ncbi:hypothetical protein T4D_8205 [Trichinella pseudospiralis]|uniref:Uncharacterized protein n=1 Tax=Trichinella pseudospiralis TaxID=6337 RepID=A0A0V1F5X8_TRIPS|nr:hypothetical protein T4D_8205 [Trichinella pseudospiralis]
MDICGVQNTADMFIDGFLEQAKCSPLFYTFLFQNVVSWHFWSTQTISGLKSLAKKFNKIDVLYRQSLQHAIPYILSKEHLSQKFDWTLVMRGLIQLPMITVSLA